MKLLLSLIGMLLAIHTIAQSDFTPIDRDEVKRLISDSSSGTHYPKLISRLKSYDTTLTLDDYRLIYYGAVFQTGYSPYGANNTPDVSEALKKKRYDQVVKICDDIIKKNPVSLRSYYYKLMALYEISGKDSLFDRTRFQYSRFLDAIVSTGDGVKCTTAFRVIAVSDEYDVMFRYYQIEEFKSQALVSPCDKMHITPSKYFDQEYMYFDVSESFRAMENMFKK